MRIIILTITPRGMASRVVPELRKNKKIDIVRVVLAHGVSPHRAKTLKRKIQKTWKIGLLGALNGVRIRKWYEDSEAEDIHSVCNSSGIELSESPFINCDTTRALFREAGADVGLSLGNGYIPRSVFSIPINGMINIHTEVLPEFQGAQSIIWPIYEGQPETGFTIHQINSKIDAGDILYQERYPITFLPTLRETVVNGLTVARRRIPKAFSYVCENYADLRREALPQHGGKSYTTPSLRQFVRMARNHRVMYSRSRTGGSS